MKTYLTLILVLLISQLSLGQDRSYLIQRTSSSIVIDGLLDDEAWKEAQKGAGFMQYFPSDLDSAQSQTEFYLMYDDEFLYFGAKMYNQSNDREYVTQSLRRDFRGGSNDGISIIFDTFQDQTNAFMFGVNPFGVQREALISNGGARRDNFSLSWDNKWYAEAAQHEGYWTSEVAIPFKTLRYKNGGRAWNFNIYRIDSEQGERSTWTPIPRNYTLFSLAFTSELAWDQPLAKPGPNISLIPYVAGGVTRDFEDSNENSAQVAREIGGDAKVALGPSLNLDLTVNPDFSQVEVDQQVTNLDRFEIFFPERRQFFLENDDLFSNWGHPFLAKPFFSRRIGIAYDSVQELNVQNKILFGARLSGKLDNNWRVGLLNMQAAADDAIDLPSLNYTVGVVQRKMFTRSNIGAFVVNKQSFEDQQGDFTVAPSTYNRVVGVDYNLASADNKWIGKVLYHKSFDETPDPEEYAHVAFLLYRSRTWQFDWAHVLVGDNYDAQVGFVPRTGIFRINPEIGYNLYPESGIVNQHTITTDVENFWKDDRRTDSRYTIKDDMRFKNTGGLEVSLNRRYTYLLQPFDPTNTDGEPLPADTDYSYSSVEFSYRSDFRKRLGYTVRGYFGEFFNGTRYNLTTEFNVRFQPFGAIRLNMNYNRISLPAPHSTADLLLVGPRFDVTMTKKLFFTSFLQYNNQINNLNINTRLQWRFKPVSDLFIVYTDNYGTENFSDGFDLRKKNRALIVKLTYWLNL